MFDALPATACQTVNFLLLPCFSMQAFTSALEPLRCANRISGHVLYEWHVASVDGKQVAASNGVRLDPEGDLAALPSPGTVVICGGLGLEHYRNSELERWLRIQARSGRSLGAVCTGTLVLARAGLLDGFRCTIHWENVEGFVEEFPRLDLTATLYEIDGLRFTCSGGTAPLDMMLYAIHHRHGESLAHQVAEQMLHAIARLPHDTQRLPLSERTGSSHPKLLAVIARMEAFLENPVTVYDLGGAIGLSPRQLERLFRHHLATTPKRYYLELRLKRARLLLRQTTMPILQVAVACGFTSGSHFAQSYRAVFGYSPRAERSRPQASGTPGTRPIAA